MACGFDISKTFIFSDFDYVGGSFYENMVKIAKCVRYNKVVGIFGFSGEDHIGKSQLSTCSGSSTFPSSFPHLFSGKDSLHCLIPCAIGQVYSHSCPDKFTNFYIKLFSDGIRIFLDIDIIKQDETMK